MFGHASTSIRGGMIHERHSQLDPWNADQNMIGKSEPLIACGNSKRPVIWTSTRMRSRSTHFAIA